MQLEQRLARARGQRKKAQSHRRKRTAQHASWVLQPIETLDCESEFQKTKEELQSFILRSDENDREVIQKLVERLKAVGEERALFLLIETARYFENVGDVEQGLRLLESCVANALRIGDLNLQRKAFNNIATAYAKLCDFENACLYHEKAHRLASCLNDPIYKFASLCNIVSLLQGMGLVRAAKRIALDLLSYPDGTPSLDYLHVQNSVNGLQLSRATEDYISARKFNRVALKKLKTANPVGEVWKAYISANRAWCLCQEGLVGKAVQVIDRAIIESLKTNNGRVNVILVCARANNAIYSSDAVRVAASKRELEALLFERQLLPVHREDVLRALIDLYSTALDGDERKVGMNYLRQLNDHLINVNHKRFFERMSAAESLHESEAIVLSAPFYAIPSVISFAAATEPGYNGIPQAAVVDVDRHVDEQLFRKLSTGAQLIETCRRTRSYCIAEDWAVAADFASEHEHHHCFMVGHIARCISLQLGFSDEDAITIEMACRLHDIGKISLRETTHRAFNAGSLDDYCMIREHALAGARLLSSSKDPLLQVAAGIAHHHHEWWNGCGLPDGQAASEISVEARICAVADCYVSLLHPAGDRASWLNDDALKQVTAMGGVQLDPNLIEPLIKAVEQCSLNSTEYIAGEDNNRTVSGLFIAKRKLLTSAGVETKIRIG